MTKIHYHLQYGYRLAHRRMEHVKERWVTSVAPFEAGQCQEDQPTTRYVGEPIQVCTCLLTHEQEVNKAKPRSEHICEQNQYLLLYATKVLWLFASQHYLGNKMIEGEQKGQAKIRIYHFYY